MNALTIHRLARAAAARGLRPVALALDTVGFVLFSCSVSHVVEIGEGTVLTHRGLGVVIHRDARIGRDCVICPNCVLGSRHAFNAPTLEDDVIVGANATIIGAITIGRGARIGAGSVVLDDVPPGGVVVGNPARLVSRSTRPREASQSLIG